MINIKEDFHLSEVIRHFILSWLLAVIVEYALLPSNIRNLAGLAGLEKMSFFRLVTTTVVGTLLLSILSSKWDIRMIERWAIVAASFSLIFMTLLFSFTWPFFLSCVLCMGIFLVYGRYGYSSTAEAVHAVYRSHPCYMGLTVIFTAIFIVFVSAWNVSRIYTFSTPSYDFGLFSQMFYNMKNSGVPMTTLERDGLLSHFYVHISPIYYLMLPFYYLFPKPATLQVLQVLVIASSVIPLWKIAKIHGLLDWQRMLLCTTILLYPALSGGTGYDIHENCFLTPLILWIFYGIDRQHSGIIVCSAILTLMVKEDAAVYVAVISLWVIIRSILTNGCDDKKLLRIGGYTFVLSLVWFFLATAFLSRVGDGVMTYRYNNFMYDGSASLITVIKAVLLNPLKALYECVDSEKLKFIGLTMLPLLGLPFMTRRYERYILLIPYLLVNLMSDYQYQHDIFFQYTFGSTACLIYLTTVNLADFKEQHYKVSALVVTALICAICFGTVIVPKAMKYPTQYLKYSDYYDQIDDALAEIPQNVSVAATTFYTTKLSQRDVLYDVKYCSQEHLLDCKYVVLSNTDENYEKIENIIISEGYVIFDTIPDVLTIYYKK